MSDSFLTAAILLVVIITLGIVGGRYMTKRLTQLYAPPPKHVGEAEAARVVQPPSSVEDFLDRYPNV